jgi:hypothetical protein
MRMNPLARLAMSTALAFGLSLGLGVTPAAADTIPAPKLQSLRLEGTEAFVAFQDLSQDEHGFVITVRERDNPDRVVLNAAPLPGGGAPGKNRVITQQVGGLPPGVPLCAFVQSAGLSSGFGAAELAGLETISPPSNTVCADPAVTANAPDLALENIRGKAEQQWTTVQSQAPAYLVAFQNAGGEASGITVDISTSGVATLGDQGAVAGGWTAAGFTCATRSPSGRRERRNALHRRETRAGSGQQPDSHHQVHRPGPGQHPRTNQRYWHRRQSGQQRHSARRAGPLTPQFACGVSRRVPVGSCGGPVRRGSEYRACDRCVPD